jgi:hypothetical protein
VFFLCLAGITEAKATAMPNVELGILKFEFRSTNVELCGGSRCQYIDDASGSYSGLMAAWRNSLSAGAEDKIAGFSW